MRLTCIYFLFFAGNKQMCVCEMYDCLNKPRKDFFFFNSHIKYFNFKRITFTFSIKLQSFYFLCIKFFFKFSLKHFYFVYITRINCGGW